MNNKKVISLRFLNVKFDIEICNAGSAHGKITSHSVKIRLMVHDKQNIQSTYRIICDMFIVMP